MINGRPTSAPPSGSSVSSIVIPETLRDIWTPTLFAQLAAERLRRGAPLIGAARVVVTDRLHAALLGLLMGRAVIALDNFYGKIRRYSAAWFPGMPGLYFAEDFDSARRLAQEIVQGGTLAVVGPRLTQP